MKKTELQVDVIYRLRNGFEGLNLCVLKSNRNNPIKNKKMMDGCLAVGMQSPGIFADALLAMQAGYELIDVEDGHTVTEDEVNDYLVIVDGNTRFHALEIALKAQKPFEYLFQYKKYRDSDDLRTAYLKMNVCNTPTTTADFARDLEATSNHPVISSYRMKISDGLVAKAAGWATIGREIVKKDMVELQKGNTPALFNDKQNLSLFSQVYDALTPFRQASPNTFKGTEIWSWNANKINGADDKHSMVKTIIKMFNIMSYADGKALENAKRSGNDPKEVVVKRILDQMFDKVQ